MDAIAKAHFARYAPRKVQQVLNLVRNKTASEAFNILKFVPKASTTLVQKVLKSAVANLGYLKTPEKVYIKSCWVNKGPVLKRYRPRAYGRAATYTRKTCHLTIIVTDKIPKS